MRIRLSAYIAIQLVPSAWSMWPPVGSVRAAVEDADVVEAEEAALEDVAALRVLAVDPPGEVQHQLVEHALEERRDRRRRRAACDRSGTRATSPTRAPADSRRRTPTRTRASGRSGACTTRASAGRAAPWRTRRRSARAADEWNARSHAAYHGYSHLSGIEMMSALLRWSHSRLRPCLRSAGGGDLRLVALQPLRHVVVEELLAPDHSGERLALDQARVGVGKIVLDLRRRTRRLRARARRRSHRSPRRAAGMSLLREPRADLRPSRRRARRADTTPPPSFRPARDSLRGRCSFTTRSWKASLA